MVSLLPLLLVPASSSTLDAQSPMAPALADLQAQAPILPLRISGLITAVLTPFDSNGALALGVVPDQMQYLNATGCNWVFVGGTTGESLSLTIPERKQLFDAWLSPSRAFPFDVIAHVGAESIEDAKDLARHAAAGGARAIGVMPPSFFKPASAQALAATVAAVCNAAPSLPCYYYHIPSMNEVAIPMFDFVKAIEPLAANFVGLKYTGMYTFPGMYGASKVIAYKDGKYEVLSGREEMMLEAVAIGIRGFVGSQFNVAADLYNRLLQKALVEGITERSRPGLLALQSKSHALLDAWQVPLGSKGHDGFKFFAQLAGIKVGEARLPTLPLDHGQQKVLADSFRAFCASESGIGLKMCANT